MMPPEQIQKKQLDADIKETLDGIEALLRGNFSDLDVISEAHERIIDYLKGHPNDNPN